MLHPPFNRLRVTFKVSSQRRIGYGAPHAASNQLYKGFDTGNVIYGFKIQQILTKNCICMTPLPTPVIINIVLDKRLWINLPARDSPAFRAVLKLALPVTRQDGGIPSTSKLHCIQLFQFHILCNSSKIISCLLRSQDRSNKPVRCSG